jgi:hypothetical protein
MADLITHAAVAVLAQRLVRSPQVACLVAGSVLPDLLSRLPSMFFAEVDRRVHPLPTLLQFGWEPFHLPVGMLLASMGLALLFPEAHRRQVLAALLGGMALHLGLDLLQDHLGQGYLLGFPFIRGSFELGWIGSEATVPWAPLLVAIAAWSWRHPPKAQMLVAQRPVDSAEE